MKTQLPYGTEYTVKYELPIWTIFETENKNKNETVRPPRLDFRRVLLKSHLTITIVYL